MAAHKLKDMVKVAQQNSLFAPLTKLMRSVKERGWEGTMMQLYLVRFEPSQRNNQYAQTLTHSHTHKHKHKHLTPQKNNRLVILNLAH